MREIEEIQGRRGKKRFGENTPVTGIVEQLTKMNRSEHLGSDRFFLEILWKRKVDANSGT